MKTRYLIFVGIIFLVSLVSIACSDNESLPLPPNNKTLAFSDTTNVFFSSITGSPDGAITDMALGDYRTNHVKAFAGGSVFNNQFGVIANPSIEFIEGVDTVILKGHAYMLEGLSTVSTGVMEERFQYKFENEALMFYEVGEERWYTFGYGTKDKIDVYYAFYIIALGGQNNDLHYWDTFGVITNYLVKFITKEDAARINKDFNWTKVFNWLAPQFPKGELDMDKMKYKSNGLSYSVYKFTFLPKTKM